jgi:hypothetical protein
MGHEDQFPLRRLTARSVIRKRTVAATRGNGRDAPLAGRRVYLHPRKQSAAFQRGGAVNGRL